QSGAPSFWAGFGFCVRRLLATATQTHAGSHEAATKQGDAGRLRDFPRRDSHKRANAAEDAFVGPDGGNVIVDIDPDDIVQGVEIKSDGEVVNVAVDFLA